MNQSNKALRDGLRNCFTDSSLDSFMRGATGKSDHSDLHEKYIDRALALVTNHIKGNMPRKYTDAQVFNSREFYGYNQALDEVQSILEEVSNGLPR